MIRKSDKKIKVFISSICDKNRYEYRIVRRSIKLILEETGLFKVYLFENGIAETVSAEESFSYEIEKSDLIVFIIDNDEAISDGVQKEIDKAKEKNKPQLYFVCTENNRESTVILDIMKSYKYFEKYNEAEHFADIPEAVYYSVSHEIIRNYNEYSEGRIQRIPQSKETDKNEINIPMPKFKEVSKEFLRGFPYTKHLIEDEMGVSFGTVEDYEEEDGAVASLMSCFIGNSCKEDVDFELIKKCVIKHSKRSTRDLILKRYDAIEKYFNDDLEGCIKMLKQCITICNNTNSIPKWLKNDVALDLRNIQHKKGFQNNIIISTGSDGQRILNEDNQPLYYPVIDRLVADYEKDLIAIRNNVKKTNKTVDLAGLYGVIEKLCQLFIVPYVYGSLTQMQLFRRRWFELIKSYLPRDNDKKQYLLAVRLLVLDNDSRALNGFISDVLDTLNVDYGLNCIDAEDVVGIIQMLDNHPVKFEKNIGQMMVVKHFGYYLSDSLFKENVRQIEKKVKEYIKNDKYTFLIIPHYLNMSIRVRERIDKKRLLRIIYSIYNNKLVAYYKDFVKVLGQINITDIDKKAQQTYQNFLIKLCKSRDVVHTNYDFRMALCHMKQQGCVDNGRLEEVIMKKFPDYYNNGYTLNTKRMKKRESWKHIKKCLKEINNQNKLRNQGIHISTERNPYKTIMRIIANNRISLTYGNVKEIVGSLGNTICSENQVRSEKIDALATLSYVATLVDNNEDIEEMVDKIISNETLIHRGKDDYLLSGYSFYNVLMHFELLKLFTKRSDNGLLTQRIMELYEGDVTSNIVFIKNLLFLLRKSDLHFLNPWEVDTLVQYLLYSTHRESSVIRFNASASLVHLLNYKRVKSIQFRLITMILQDNCNIRIGLLKELFFVKNNEKVKEIIDAVYEEAIKDSNYWVRKVADEKE